jgi:hypothetical protein
MAAARDKVPAGWGASDPVLKASSVREGGRFARFRVAVLGVALFVVVIEALHAVTREYREGGPSVLVSVFGAASQSMIVPGGPATPAFVRSEAPKDDAVASATDNALLGVLVL